MERQEIAARLVRELTAERFDSVRQLTGLETEHVRNEADARLERIIRETAQHFGSMAPAIIAMARHVTLNVDGVADGINECDCLETAGA